MQRPLVSFVIATHNRRDVLIRTLRGIRACGLAESEMQLIVVDNASSDSTRKAIAADVDRLLRLRRNYGSCAKALGTRHAHGDMIVFLDDDSYPEPGSVQRMLRYFSDDPVLGAAGFAVTLPDGRREGAALPGVFVGCGVGIRTAALRGCGGLDLSFFMQAEEYDLCFRLVGDGWRTAVFDDLVVVHNKTPTARLSGRTVYYDIRNNLRVLARYAPSEHLESLRMDIQQRYKWLANRDGHRTHYQRGLTAGLAMSSRERRKFRHRRLNVESFEYLYRWNEVARNMLRLQRSGVRRVLFAGFGKNIFPFHESARRLGIDVVAIADDNFHADTRAYRGISIVPTKTATGLEFDAVVVSDTSAVHSARTFAQWKDRTPAPVHAWFSGHSAADLAGSVGSMTPQASTRDVVHAG